MYLLLSHCQHKLSSLAIQFAAWRDPNTTVACVQLYVRIQNRPSDRLNLDRDFVIGESLKSTHGFMEQPPNTKK